VSKSEFEEETFSIHEQFMYLVEKLTANSFFSLRYAGPSSYAHDCSGRPGRGLAGRRDDLSLIDI
jgi:hypothetical protein